MAIRKNESFNLERIQKEFEISSDRIYNLDISTKELTKIYDDYVASIGELEKVRESILTVLNNELPDIVHSIRCRIKKPDHLIEKIIRNVNDKPDKYAGINEENYNKIITDLIGVRIILLDKRDWKAVHKQLLKIFRNMPERYAVNPKDIIRKYDEFQKEAEVKNKLLENSYHAEMPVVYITSNDDKDLYLDEYLKVDSSKTHYRSIHYIIRYGKFYFEIQVRTLFEEGWLEFDHRVKYPYDSKNVKKQNYVGILSSLAVTADRLISFYDENDFKNDIKSLEIKKEAAYKQQMNASKQENIQDILVSLF